MLRANELSLFYGHNMAHDNIDTFSVHWLQTDSRFNLRSSWIGSALRSTRDVVTESYVEQ